MLRRFTFLIIVLSWSGTTASAFVFGTRIGTVQDDPNRYVGEIVGLVGEVATARSLPFTELFLQRVYDQSGTLLILTTEDRDVGEKFRGRVKIYGIAIEAMETGSEQTISGIAEFLADRDLVTRQDARRAARRVLAFLDQVFNAMDVSLLGVEE